ncbi:MAG: hypothetical protein ACK4YD_09275 [Chitinophagia bacterium]|jgi:hypothetical protein
MTRKLISLIVFIWLSGDTTASTNPTFSFIENDLNDLLSTHTKKQGQNNLIFQYNIDKNLLNGSFAYEIRKQKNITKIILSGAAEAEINHAGHSFLEHLGFQFEITGTEIPEKIRTDTLKNGKYIITPYTRWRGIRQHVNFPMDISSYPLEEAKEYLSRLMRMRFNQIAIHSYPNLWHEVKTGDSTELAGDFFYNRPHIIPDFPVIRNNIRFNNKYYSIPSIEPFYEDKATKSKMSVEWMSVLLEHAKKIGFNIHFSIEPRAKGDIEYIIDNCRSAIENYPMIDELEINTEELGGWGSACTDEEVKNILVKRFGSDVLKDEFVMNRIQKNQTDLDNLLNQIGRNMEASRRLQQMNWFREKNIKLKLGIYCTIVSHADVAYHLVRKYLPDTELTIMPGHGSVRTSNHFSRISKSEEDLSKTTIFSWIEFDGLMFTQQNPVEGIDNLFHQLDSIRKGKQLNAVLFNHWRTAENKIAAKYAANVSIYGPLPRKEYYLQYARRKNITDPENYTSAMILLEEIDKISTDQLPNYGFCWLGAWMNGGPYSWIDRKILEKVRSKYDTVQTSFSKIAQTVKNTYSKAEIDFLNNRVLASIHYINAFHAGCEIQELITSKADTSKPEIKEKALQIFRTAYSAYVRYMETHTQYMPDRGCEGTLINLWHGPIYGLKVWRNKLTGIPLTDPLDNGKDGEGPPLPIRFER